MSQDIREYDLESVDGDRYGMPNEATQLNVTATVGPTVEEQTRGVQLTLSAPGGTVYGRLSEQQVRDLITTLSRRVNPTDETFEATLSGSGNVRIAPSGEKE